MTADIVENSTSSAVIDRRYVRMRAPRANLLSPPPFAVGAVYEDVNELDRSGIPLFAGEGNGLGFRS
jgi:hypothetical protein